MANTQGIKAGRAYVEIGIGDKLSAGLKRAQMRLKAFAAGVTRWGTCIFALGSACAPPARRRRELLRQDGRSGRQDGQAAGLSVETLSELRLAQREQECRRKREAEGRCHQARMLGNASEITTAAWESPTPPAGQQGAC